MGTRPPRPGQQRVLLLHRAFRGLRRVHRRRGLHAAGEGGRTGDSLSIRGFSANSDTYIDNLKDNGQYFRDTFNVEQVEVLKGPSGLYFGRGVTGGARFADS